MLPETSYFLKVNIALVLFYACYRLLFYKDTFFILRRAFLLLCFGLAIAYPLLDIREWMEKQEPMAGLILIYSALLPGVEATTDGPAGAGWQKIFRQAAPVAYWTGAVLLILRFLIQSGCILRLALRSRPLCIRNTKVYVLDKPSVPFSFFRLIFLYPGKHSVKETDEILTHELTHASQWHSIDILISEWMCMLCWMNPFVWLLKREVRYNLEYLADNSVLASGFDSRSYQYHLLGLTTSHPPQAAANLYNNFNVLHLKNRISMMNRKRSRPIGRTKYLVLLPLAALLMLLAQCGGGHSESKPAAAESEASLQPEAPESNLQPEAPEDNQKQVYTVVEEMPIFPGGDDKLLQFLATNLKYPPEAQNKGIQGRVVASFIVNEDGRISDIKIVRSLDPLLDAESIRVIQSMPLWTPGKQGGVPVATKYTIPLTFRLQ
jgi:TonB family protein